MKNYVCAYYLYFPQTKLHVANKGFENITYNDISGISIPELLMNIISCHGFVNNMTSDVILSCRRKLVDYYLPKGFVILEKNSSTLINVPLRAKQRINSEDIYKNDLVMAFEIEIPSESNNLKIITVCSGLYTDFVSTY